MTVRKIKKPTRKYDAIDVTEAAAFYIDFNGDLDKLKARLGRKWTKNDLRYYEESNHWPMLLNRAQQQIDEKTIEDAVRRRVDQLARMRNIRIKLYRQIMPVEGKTGASASSMEGCASAFAKIVELEREVSGDKNQVPMPTAGIFVFLRDRILQEKTLAQDTSRSATVTIGDSNERFRF